MKLTIESPITEEMLEAGIEALEEVAGVTYRRALAVDVYIAMEQARLKRQNQPGKGCLLSPCEQAIASNMQ